MEEKDNQLEGKPHRAVRSRLGMLKGKLAVPDDFDRMGRRRSPICLKELLNTDAAIALGVGGDRAPEVLRAHLINVA